MHKVTAVQDACRAAGCSAMHSNYKPRPALAVAGGIVNFNRPVESITAHAAFEELQLQQPTQPLIEGQEPDPQQLKQRGRHRHRAAEHIAAIRGGAIYKPVQTSEELSLFSRIGTAHLVDGADTEFSKYEDMATEWSVVMAQEGLVAQEGNQMKFSGNVFFKSARQLKEHHVKLLSAQQHAIQERCMPTPQQPQSRPTADTSTLSSPAQSLHQAGSYFCQVFDSMPQATQQPAPRVHAISGPPRLPQTP